VYVQCLSCSVTLAGLAVTNHHHLVHPSTDSSHLCLPDHTPPLAMTDHYLPLHQSTCRNQTLSVCTPFHLQESNIVCVPFHWRESHIVCVHTIPLAGIKHCVHAILLAGIKHCLCSHCSTCRNQTLCSHYSIGRNQTLSVCTLFHWQE